MVRIPVGNFGVQAQGTPGGMVSTNVAPGAFGQGLASGLSDVSQVMRQVEHQANVARVEDALNQVQQNALDLKSQAATIKGANVFAVGNGPNGPQDLTSTSLQDFDAHTEEVAAGLANEQQKAMFQQHAFKFRENLQAHLQDHQNRESLAYETDTYNGAIKVADQDVAQNALSPDGRIQAATISTALARKAFAASQLSSVLGEGEDLKKARILEAQSGTHALVLDALLKTNNPQGARAYFDVHRDQLTTPVISAMEGKIAETTLALNVQKQADLISATGLPLDQQDLKAREAMAGNPDGMKLLTSELEHRFSVKQTAVAAATKDVTGRLWDMRFPTLPGQQAQSLPAIMRTPEWNALDGTQRNELRAQWEAHAKRNENDPATMVAKFATYMKMLDDPKALIGMSDPQIVSFLGALGPDLTKKLLEAKREALGDYGKLYKATLNDIPFKDIAGEYGLKVKGNLLPEDMAKLGMLRDRAVDAIKDEQTATGKALLPDRKEEIVRGLLRKVTVQEMRGKYSPMRLFGDQYDSVGEKPLFQVGSAMDLEGTDAEKAQALDYLTQAGAPHTPSNVQTMLDAIRAKKAK